MNADSSWSWAVAALSVFTLAAIGAGCTGPDEAPPADREVGGLANSELPRLAFLGSTDGLVAFGEVRYFDVQSDGRIIVADRMSSRVHVVDPDGSHATLGGPGRGPGELATPGGLATLEDGSIVVFDAGNGRITTRGSDGQVLGQHPAHPLYTEALAAVGSTVFLTSRLPGASEMGPGFDLLLSHGRGLNPDSWDSLPLVASDLEWQVDQTSDTLSCGPCALVAIDEDRILLGHPGSYRFRIVSVRNRQVVAAFGRPELPRERHTLRSWEASVERNIDHLAMLEQGVLGRTTSTFRERQRDRPVPDPLPLAFPLASPFPVGVDGEGRIWVLRNTLEEGVSDFDLFGPNFEFLGEYRLTGHALTSIRVRGEFLAGRSEGAAGVAEIRLFRIAR